MNSLVELINTVLDSALQPLFSKIAWLGALGSVSLVSAVLGIVFLVIYGRVSNQDAIRRTKQKIFATFLEAIVFRHDLMLSLRAQGRMALLAGVYLARMLPPLLVIIPLGLPLLAHLHRIYGVAPLPIESPALVKVFTEPGRALPKISALASDQLLLVGPLRDPSNNSSIFRVSVTQPGIHPLHLMANNKQVASIQIIALENWTSHGINTQVSQSWWKNLIYPASDAWSFDATVIKAIELNLPEASYSIFGFSASWLSVFLVVSIASGLIAGKILKIEV